MGEIMVHLEIGTSYEFASRIPRNPSYFETDVDVANLIPR